MAIDKKWIWGGLGWVMGGPIGAILGYAFASMTDNQKSHWTDAQRSGRAYKQTRSGDFVITLLVLFAKVMKADGQLLKSELDYVKQFLIKNFGKQQSQRFMQLFKDVLEQEYPLKDVCRQIQRSMDHPARLELIHILFGLSMADGHVHPEEIKVIHTIANYLNINHRDYESIKAMFATDPAHNYRILEVDKSATDNEVKKAYRKMATKYHPDKVAHLGDDMQKLAEEKFKAVNDAYQQIKKDRGMS